MHIVVQFPKKQFWFFFIKGFFVLKSEGKDNVCSIFQLYRYNINRNAMKGHDTLSVVSDKW